MLSFLLRPVRFLFRALIDQDSPKQLAWGFALGAMIGLIPKGNLLAIGLMTAVCACRVNLASVGLGAFVFSWIGVLTDPLTHRWGLHLLQQESLHSTWVYLYDLPVVPWTRFNNTVVLGSFLLGLMVVLPLFLVTYPVAKRWQPPLADRLRKYRLIKWLLGGADYTSRLQDA